MADFNPDQYLAEKTASVFDPDQYLQEKTGYTPMDPNEPGLQDVSIPDALTVQGVAGLGKAALGGAGRTLAETVAPTLERSAGNNALRGLGASVGQVRQLGPEVAREAGQYGLKNGLSDVFSSEIGREAKLKALQEATGKQIGALRQEAGAAPSGIADTIATKLNPKYAEGVYSGEKGGLEKALDEVRNAGPNHADLSKAATKLNNYAAGAKLTQPANAATDVANELSRTNNEGIVQSLGADKGKDYLQALEDMTKQKPLEAFMARGEAKEAAGRGSNTLYGAATGAVKDAFGNRLAAKAANLGADIAGAGGSALKALSSAIPASSSIGTNALQLTPSAVAEWLSRNDKSQQGLAEGGTVQPQSKINDISDQIRDWVNGYRSSDYGTLPGLRDSMRKASQDSEDPQPEEDKAKKPTEEDQE